MWCLSLVAASGSYSLLWRTGLLIVGALLVVEHRLQVHELVVAQRLSTSGLWALECRLSSRGAWA